MTVKIHLVCLSIKQYMHGCHWNHISRVRKNKHIGRFHFYHVGWIWYFRSVMAKLLYLPFDISCMYNSLQIFSHWYFVYTSLMSDKQVWHRHIWFDLYLHKCSNFYFIWLYIYISRTTEGFGLYELWTTHSSCCTREATHNEMETLLWLLC